MKISIITAVYNRANVVGEAIASVRNQTHRDIEHIIVDGASTDGTLAAVQSQVDDRARVLSEPDRGIYDALNKGMKMATGEVVGLMHSDDFYADSEVLADVAKAMGAPGIDAVYGDLDYVSKFDTSKIVRQWRSGSFNVSKMRNGWMPPHPTVFVRRSVIEAYGAFDTRYRIAADYDQMTRYLWRHSVQPAYLERVLVKMRVGGESNQSLRKILKKSQEDWAILRGLQIGRISATRALIFKNMSKIGQFQL